MMTVVLSLHIGSRFHFKGGNEKEVGVDLPMISDGHQTKNKEREESKMTDGRVVAKTLFHHKIITGTVHQPPLMALPMTVNTNGNHDQRGGEKDKVKMSFSYMIT